MDDKTPEELEKEETERQELERQEAEKQELEKQEAERQELERQEQKNRTHLGRKVAGMEARFSEIMDSVSQINERLNSIGRKPEAEEEDLSAYSTKEDVARIAKATIEKTLKEETEATTMYNKKYNETLAKLGAGMDEKTYASIIKEIVTNYNYRRHDIADVDAEINFRNAERAIVDAENSLLRRQLSAGKKPPKEIEKPLGGIKTPGGGESPTVTLDMGSLTESQQKMVKYLRDTRGSSDTDIIEILQGSDKE